MSDYDYVLSSLNLDADVDELNNIKSTLEARIIQYESSIEEYKTQLAALNKKIEMFSSDISVKDQVIGMINKMREVGLDDAAIRTALLQTFPPVNQNFANKFKPPVPIKGIVKSSLSQEMQDAILQKVIDAGQDGMRLTEFNKYPEFDAIEKQEISTVLRNAVFNNLLSRDGYKKGQKYIAKI